MSYYVGILGTYGNEDEGKILEKVELGLEKALAVKSSYEDLDGDETTYIVFRDVNSEFERLALAAIQKYQGFFSTNIKTIGLIYNDKKVGYLEFDKEVYYTNKTMEEAFNMNCDVLIYLGSLKKNSSLVKGLDKIEKIIEVT